MRKLVLLLMILCLIPKVSASESTKYLANCYKDECGRPVKIISKKEYIEIFQQVLGNDSIVYIAYGNGYMKCPRKKKIRISYICLYDKDCSPIWGQVIPQE